MYWRKLLPTLILSLTAAFFPMVAFGSSDNVIAEKGKGGGGHHGKHGGHHGKHGGHHGKHWNHHKNWDRGNWGGSYYYSRPYQNSYPYYYNSYNSYPYYYDSYYPYYYDSSPGVSVQFGW